MVVHVSDNPLNLERRRSASIIIPAYNAERFLEGTLQSALAQDYDQFDIIVVNDGSTDRTAEIASDYCKSDSRVHLLSTINNGVAAARNAGIHYSNAEYVAFLDADDLWLPDKLRRQIELLEQKHEYAAAYTWSVVIDEDDMVLNPTASWNFDGYILCQHLITWPVGNGSSLVVRRNAAVSIGGYDTDFRKLGCGGTEDLDFELRLAERYRITCVPSFLVGYRRYPGNMSSDGKRMARSAILTIDRALERNPSLPTKCSRWARATAYAYAANSCRPSLELARYLLILLTFETRLGFQILGRKSRSFLRRLEVLFGAAGDRQQASISFYLWSSSQPFMFDTAIKRRVEKMMSIDRMLEPQRSRRWHEATLSDSPKQQALSVGDPTLSSRR
ncbi:glycosyltransferase family 2 protein [Microvirga aerilata]|uniref:Glycosyltransferase family 2 protein n=1 Tax=Microvirga aerilata TaxID=670292 RepID=A0A936ZDJ2_9HYPH|nr:glycosyltransferase family 2 protein [Microvirga aerilata]MBL0408247.1 glycosyltransferase family 2 protein [Microvirga aerilata]